MNMDNIWKKIMDDVVFSLEMKCKEEKNLKYGYFYKNDIDYKDPKYIKKCKAKSNACINGMPKIFVMSILPSEPLEIIMNVLQDIQSAQKPVEIC